MRSQKPSKDKAQGATRRSLLGVMAAGAAGGALAPAFAAGAQEQVTEQTLACAEPLFDVSYTDAEREQMARGIDDWVARVEALRAYEKPNALAPALTFDPRLPDVAYAVQPNAVTGTAGAAGPLPSRREDIAFAPAWKLAAWMEAGAVSSADLTELYLARIEAHNPALNAYITVTPELARTQARRADAERAAGRVRGPLHGVPYALKDIIDVADYPATWGATPYRERVASETAYVARRLEEAGAVLLGKTSVGALAYGDIWFDGISRNPFNPNEGSSGSSAGSASATAAGLCGFSIGTETLGSIVSPSHRCGATGLRPTFGRVARTGAMALCWSLDKIGPICRSAADTGLVLAAINGADAGDAASFDHGLSVDLGRSVRGLRVGYNPQWMEQGSDADRAALEAARGLGVELVEFSLDPLPLGALAIQLESEAAAAFEDLTLQNIDDTLRWQEDRAWPNTFRRARFASAVDLVNADRIRRQAMTMMHAKFDGLDAMIGPNFAGGMLLITNFTGHPQLAFRAGFEQTPTRTIFGEPADESGQSFETPVASSLWAPLLQEGTLVSLGAAIERELGVADIRPAAFN